MPVAPLTGDEGMTISTCPEGPSTHISGVLSNKAFRLWYLGPKVLVLGSTTLFREIPA